MLKRKVNTNAPFSLAKKGPVGFKGAAQEALLAALSNGANANQVLQNAKKLANKWNKTEKKKKIVRR